ELPSEPDEHRASASLLPGEVRHPVLLPDLSVERELLLPARGVGAEHGPAEPDLDGLALVDVLALKEAAVAVEAAEHRGEQVAAQGADPVDGPALPLGIEDPEAEPGEAARRVVVLVDVDHSSQQLLEVVGGRELVPLGSLRPPFLEAAVLDVPRAEEEIEIGDLAGGSGGAHGPSLAPIWYERQGQFSPSSPDQALSVRDRASPGRARPQAFRRPPGPTGRGRSPARRRRARLHPGGPPVRRGGAPPAQGARWG